MKVTIKPVTAQLLDDFFYFFDRVAFTDNPDWASCYCYYYHIACGAGQWAKRSKEKNRAGARQLILSGKMGGYLAYVNESPVGWCNANDKEKYARLLAEQELWYREDKKIGSVVCFIIAPNHRRKGIARQLLKEACSVFRSEGFDYLEAYPRKGELNDAQHYHGPLSMYKKAGFRVFKEFQDFFIVRKKL